jgi:hypothetical protein
MIVDVGFINTPARGTRPAPLPAQAFPNLGGVGPGPATSRGAVDRDAALADHRFEITVAHPLAAVPARCPEPNLAFKWRPLKSDTPQPFRTLLIGGQQP